jgi:hypothetical protein
MGVPREEVSVTFEQVCLAHFLAVMSGSFAFSVMIEIADAISTEWCQAVSIIGVPIGPSHLSISALVPTTLTTTILVWLPAYLASILPFFVGLVAIDILHSYQRAIFLAWGTITAAVPCALLAAIPVFDRDGTVESSAAGYISLLPIFLMSGAVAGTVCWEYLRRRLVRIRHAREA